jgi:hypothetical protein
MMNNNFILFILLSLVGFVLWFMFLSPQAQEKKTIRLRLEAEERERKEAKKKRLAKERASYIKSIQGNRPDFITQARIEFERAYKASGGNTSFFGQEKSPLSCFGYVVGKTKGRSIKERRLIIEYTLCVDIPGFFPSVYSSEWGAPLTQKRFNRISSHLTAMADLRANRINFEVAVSNWREDAAWMHKELKVKVQMLDK